MFALPIVSFQAVIVWTEEESIEIYLKPHLNSEKTRYDARIPYPFTMFSIRMNFNKSRTWQIDSAAMLEIYNTKRLQDEIFTFQYG